MLRRSCWRSIGIERYWVSRSVSVVLLEGWTTSGHEARKLGMDKQGPISKLSSYN